MANLDCQCDYIWNQLEQPWVPLWGFPGSDYLNLEDWCWPTQKDLGERPGAFCLPPSLFWASSPIPCWGVALLVLEPASSGRLKPSSSPGTLGLQSQTEASETETSWAEKPLDSWRLKSETAMVGSLRMQAGRSLKSSACIYRNNLSVPFL